jgi:epoxyqueuosine reductase
VDRSALTERVKLLAREEGFSPVGVAALAPAATAGAYREWLARGDHAGMAWMERHAELRCDPRGLLPGAMSALVVGLRYAPRPDAADEATSDLWSRVARYARGVDYHDLMRERLRRVASSVEALAPGCASRVCVDTAPLLERELAARAGLGAVGKNTLLLHPEAGSWFLLGELLLTVDLVPDAPFADLCGDCSRCLAACPTDALTAPYRLDANRCLSYWTIEHRGEVAEPIRPHLRDWVFGCDVCQEVCPWNAGAAPTAAPEFAVPSARRELSLDQLLDLGPEDFARRLRGSPLRRAKLEGLRRNAGLTLAAGAAGPRR